MQTHYVKKNTRRIACNVRSTRAASLITTDDRVTFDADRAKGLACERCCGVVDKMDAIAAKHAARAQKASPPTAAIRKCDCLGIGTPHRWEPGCP